MKVFGVELKIGDRVRLPDGHVAEVTEIHRGYRLGLVVETGKPGIFNNGQEYELVEREEAHDV